MMTTSASMVAAPIERSQVRGHRQRSENLQHRQRGRLPSLAQGTGGRGTERSPKFARVTHIGRSHARARPARAAWSVQRLVVMSAAAPAAFRFSGLLVVDSGATMELGRPGDDDVGFDGGGADRARPATGSSTKIGKSAAPTEGALAIARAGRRRPRH